MSSEAAVFWVCLLLLGYVHVGYPVVMWAWGTAGKRPLRRGGTEPTVTVVVVAYNEANRVAARLRNLLAQDYPRDRLDIVLASDGSADGTVGTARAFAPASVQVVEFAHRRGKPSVLNEVVPGVRGEIVVLADARQEFAPDAVRALVAPFADGRVGAVSGELVLTEGGERTAVGAGAGFYWRYEKFIRRHESGADSVVGATGCIYAIRRSLFQPIPDNTLLDDVLIPMTIARHGYRVLFEPGARAYDEAPRTAGQEFTRKVRTIAGNFQLFARHPWLLSPFANRLWLQTLSHKALRLVSPILLVGLLVANALLLDRPLYGYVLALQLAFYAAALAGHALRHTARLPLLSGPYMFCLLNWITVVAFHRFVTGSQAVTWRKTL